MTEEIKLRCPQCKTKLSYLNVPRTTFFVAGKEVKYETIKNQYNCPFCGFGIAGDEALAIERLQTGRFGYTTKQFEKMVKKNAQMPKGNK